jgi:hypothetical protein
LGGVGGGGYRYIQTIQTALIRIAMRINADPGLAPGQTLASLKYLNFFMKNSKPVLVQVEYLKTTSITPTNNSSIRIIYVYSIAERETIECKITDV